MSRHLRRLLSFSTLPGYEFPGKGETFLLNSKIRDLAKHGRMDEARRVFDSMPHRDATTWNFMINGFSENGMIDEARSLFDAFAGKNVRTWTALISGYAKQGRIEDAHLLFESMSERNVISWNAMISGYVQNREMEKACQLFDEMPERDIASWNSIITGYCHEHRMAEARKLFALMPERDLVSWTVMISGYAQIGSYNEAWRFFHGMMSDGLTPDKSSFVAAVSAVLDLCDKDILESLRSLAIKANFEGDVVVGTVILNAYARDRENLDLAVKFFDEMQEKNDYTWSTMISAFSHVGNLDKAISYYARDPQKYVASKTALLTGFARNGHIHEARSLFDQIPNPNVVSWNAMITGYTQNGMLDEAMELFGRMPVKNSITWATMISGFSHNGKNEEALQLLSQQHGLRMLPTVSSFTSGLFACCNIGDTEKGRQLHSLAIKAGFQHNSYINNGLITMYAKSKKMEEVNQVFMWMKARDTASWNSLIGALSENYLLEDARAAFEKMPYRDVVSWTAIISAYVQVEHGEEALKLFLKMMGEGITPHSPTIASLITACGSLCSTKLGQQIHGLAIKLGLDSELFVGNSLIAMYFKCGNTESFCIFDAMENHDIVTWNSMLVGCAQHGFGREAIEIFEQMSTEGISPNQASFVALLSACSHAGLVEEGRHYFKSMIKNYAIEPLKGHYGCMVDLLGRAGHLEEAKELIDGMPIQPDSVIWRALLGSCRIHRNVEIGRKAAEKLFEMEPQNCSNYVLLSNSYAALGMWDEVGELRTMMRERGVRKEPGCSWMQIKSKMHCFITGDKQHEQIEQINDLLEELYGRLRAVGYIPNTSFALHDVEEEQKENAVLYHSEKLAVAYALLRTAKCAPIQIMKNIRICGDCHTFIKFVSKISEREIDIRDGNRFHHFKDGICSCGDYW
ncbi:Pentatricopeptide repeat-containing protein [Apostasia shenzhenica]|uniref:Pentatricopeptide repeat-containing protein n=1 Tax=Apostasia shenzhenica TaxID=1088818 RepID=A0A2I0B934_9ASPA|nr:Pentatricopeptide repeat-containing protein [Apostasia shenzhenica]